MKVQPLSDKAQLILLSPLLIALSPILAALVGLIWLEVTVHRWLNPPGWRKVFAWWPTECDPWPERGYCGYVWLETIWKNPAALGWSKFRREAPNPAESSAGVRTTSPQDQSAHDEPITDPQTLREIRGEP